MSAETPTLPQAEAPAPEAPRGRGSGAGPAVLVVDDNTELRATICAMLAEQGMSTAEAGCAEDAFGLLAAQTFDALVIDLVMPGIHGMQLLLDIRRSAHGVSVPALVLSALPPGSTRDHAREHVRRLEYAEFLDKPVTGRRLAVALGRLINVA